MSTDPGYGKKLSSLLRSIGKVEAPSEPAGDDPMGHLVFAFLLWEAATGQAERAYRKVMKEHVDLNELRVTMPDEFVEVIGANYPRALDRAERLRACLKCLYLREHRMSLDAVGEGTKREIRSYLETLDGMTPYIAERIMLLGFGAHGVPVDEQLRKALIDAEALDDTLSISDACTWLARQIKADQAEQYHHRLQSWAESGGASKRSRTRSSSTRKTTTKKKTTRKKTGTTRKRANSK